MVETQVTESSLVASQYTHHQKVVLKNVSKTWTRLSHRWAFQAHFIATPNTQKNWFLKEKESFPTHPQLQNIISAWTFSRTDNTLNHKTSLQKSNTTEIILRSHMECWHHRQQLYILHHNTKPHILTCYRCDLTTGQPRLKGYGQNTRAMGTHKDSK